MKLRWKGDFTTEVACSGVSYGVVEPDGIVEVPDEVYEAHGWAEELWAVVGTTRKKALGEGTD